MAIGEARKAQFRYEFLLEDYKERRAEIMHYENLLNRINQFAILVSGGLLALASKFGAELLGRNAERSFLLLLISLLYIGLMWGTLRHYYRIGLLGDFVGNHLFKNIRKSAGVDDGEEEPAWNWEAYWRNQVFKSGWWEIFQNSVLTIGDYALTALPVLALWAGFSVIQYGQGGLGWSDLSWKAQVLGLFNLMCGIVTVPLVWRSIRVYVF